MPSWMHSPKPESLANFAQFAARFGYKINTKSEKETAKSLNYLMEDVEGKKEPTIFSMVASASPTSRTPEPNSQRPSSTSPLTPPYATPRERDRPPARSLECPGLAMGLRWDGR